MHLNTFACILLYTSLERKANISNTHEKKKNKMKKKRID